MTVLNLYATTQPSATTGLTTNGAIAATGTGGAETNATGGATIGASASGWIILYPRSVNATALAGTEPAFDSHCFVLDGTTLDGQTLANGTFTLKVTLIWNGGTATATIVGRIGYFDGTTFHQIGSDLSLSGQSLPLVKTTFTLSGTIPSQAFVNGNNLCYQILVNVTSAPSIAGTLKLYESSTNGSGVASDAELDTQGYSLTTTTTVETIVETATGSEIVTMQGLTLAVETITETATGTEIVALVDQFSQPVTETATGTEIVALVDQFSQPIVEGPSGSETVTANLLSIASVTEFAPGTELVSVVAITESPCSANMQAFDLAFQSQRIMGSGAGPQLKILATTYYSNASDIVIFGELDALFNFETIDKLHIMRTVCDVNAFLKAYSYASSVLQDTPAVYYRLGEASGSYAYDIAGRGMNGAINGAVTLGQAGSLAGSSDTAYLFDGTTGYIQLPAGVKTDNWPAITLEARINLSNITFTNAARILANDVPSATNLGVNFAALKNGLQFWIGTGATFYTLSFTYAFVASTWYSVAAAFDGSNMYLFINGALVASQAVTPAKIGATTGLMYISRNPGDLLNGLPGMIDEPAIYNSYIGPARLLAHSNAAINP